MRPIQLLIILFFATSMTSYGQLFVGNRTKAGEFMDSKKLLPVEVDQNGENLLVSSSFLPRLPVSGGLISRRTDSISGKTTGFRFINLPALFMITKVYDSIIGDNQTNRIVFETSDNTRFIEPSQNEVGDEDFNTWRSKYTFCYDVKVSVDRSDKLRELMRQDVERFFGITTSMQKRSRDCLVLVKTDTSDRIATKMPNDFQGNVKFKGGGMELNKASLDVLVSFLASSNGNGKLPIVNGTGYSKPVDLFIKSNLRNLASVNEELKLYGLQLIREAREIDVVVINDAK